MASGPEREEEAAAVGLRARPGRQTPLIIRWECSTRPLANLSRWCLPTASAAVTVSPSRRSGSRWPARRGSGASTRTSSWPTRAAAKRIALRWLT